MRHTSFAMLCSPIFTLSLLISLFALHGVCLAKDESAIDSQAVTYAYVGSSISAQQDYSQGIITGYAVAADGSAQAIPGFHLSGGISALTAASGFVFGVGAMGTTVDTYTRQADGSLRTTSAANVIQDYLQGEDQYVSNLNPDRSGKVLNVGAVWPNSNFVPFTIQADGSLSYLGATISGCGKSQALLTFSPDNRWAYDQCWGNYNKYGRQPTGVLDGPFDVSISQPPSPLVSGACQPVLLSSSSLGFVAVVWNGSSYFCDASQGNLLGIYALDADGNPELVPGSALAPQVWESDIAFDPSGTYFALSGYVGNQSNGAIQVFMLQSDGRPVALGDPILLSGVTNVTSVRWDNLGHLYALGAGQGTKCVGNDSGCGLYIFSVTAQGVTAAPGSPHIIASPSTLAVLPVQ